MVALVIAMMLAGARSGFADVVWDGDTNNDWNTGTNWVGGVKPAMGNIFAPGDIAVFPNINYAAVGINLPTVVGAEACAGIIINTTSAAFTLTINGALTILAGRSISVSGTNGTTITGAGNITASGALYIDNDDSGVLNLNVANINGDGSTWIKFLGAEPISVGSIIGGGATPVVIDMDLLADVVTFSGANTYTGTTTVSAGTLLVNGTHDNAANGAITVASGATLGGKGTLKGNVTVSGIVKPGDPSINSGIGTLTVGNGKNVTFNNGSYLTVDNVNAAKDILAVGGTLDFQSDNAAYITLESGQSYSLDNAVVTVTTAYNSAEKFNTTLLPAGWSIISTGGAGGGVSLHYAAAAIPTLNEWGIIIMLLLLAGTGVMIMRKWRYAGNIA